MKKIFCSCIAMLECMLLFGATIEPGDSSKRHKTDYVTNWNPGENQTYTISASASGCSFVDSKTKASDDATLKGHTPNSASAEKSIEHTDLPNTSAFGFSVSGVLAGSGSGGEVKWSATLQQKFFWLEPMEKIVSEGTAVTIAAKGVPTESTWSINNSIWKNHTVSNSEPYKTSSITLNRDMWDKMKWTPSSVPDSWKCPPAGIYNISATTTEESGARSADAIIYVVKITTSATDLFGSVEKNSDGSNKTAYIHWNIDNDNNATSSQTGKHPDADYLKTTAAVTGEDDLKPFSFTMTPAMNKGSIEISIGGNGKVWKSATKGVSSGADSQLLLDSGATKTWDLSNATQRTEFNSLGSVYIEGGVATEVPLSQSNIKMIRVLK